MNTDKLLGAARDYIPLVNKLAYYFQVRDDFINLQSQDVRPNARLIHGREIGGADLCTLN